MTKRADEAGFLETKSYVKLMDVFSSIWRSVKSDSVKQKDNNKHQIHTFDSVTKELVLLNLTTRTKEKRSP